MFGGSVAAAGITTRKLMFPASSLRTVKNVMSNPAPASPAGSLLLRDPAPSASGTAAANARRQSRSRNRDHAT